MHLYSLDSPAQSSSSLSGDDDDELDRANYSYPAEPLAPAKWATKLRPSGAQRKPLKLSPAARIPPEILIHVLRQLHSIQDLHSVLLVSRTWCECSVELLWHKPHLSKGTSLVKMMQVIGRPDQSFTYSRFIRRLNFSLLGPDVANHVVARLTVCIRLERLTLMNCSKLTDESLTKLFASCPCLVALDMTNVVEVTDAAVVALAKTATRLQGLNISNCRNITDEGFLAVARHCKLLRRMKLAGVDNVTDVSISALATMCPLLLELDLTKCVNLTDLAVRDLWIYSLHMREVKLSYCSELTEIAHPVSPSPPNVVNPFQNIRLGDDALAPLILTHQLEHLRVLDLAGCTQLTDEAVDGIVTNAPKIRNLGLAKCSQLTDLAVHSICKLGRHLHDLHLGHVSRITDHAVTDLARACTRLRYVDLACCNLLTDMAVYELANLAKLRRIGLVRVTNLTDNAIFSLGDRHTTLERIHLSYCENITVPAINYLLQKLHKLTHLSLTGVPAFRMPEYQQFCRSPPNEFTTNQRAAFCVYSGKGIHDLRKHLHSAMALMSDGMTAGPETEEDDDEEEFPSNYDQLDLDDSGEYDAHAHMAFLSQPNVNLQRGTNGHSHNARMLLQSFMQPSRSPNIPGSSTTTPSPFGGPLSFPAAALRSRSNVAVNGTGVGPSRSATDLGFFAHYGGQSEASTSAVPHGMHHVGPWALDTARAMAYRGPVYQPRARPGEPRLPFQEPVSTPPTPPTRGHSSPLHHPSTPVPFPGQHAESSAQAAQGLDEEAGGRGRRVRRSLRGALGAAEQYASALFGRRGSADARNASGGR